MKNLIENNIPNLYKDCLMLILQLRSAVQLGTEPDLRSRINSLLEDTKNQCKQLGIAPEKIRLKRRAWKNVAGVNMPKTAYASENRISVWMKPRST